MARKTPPPYCTEDKTSKVLRTRGVFNIWSLTCAQTWGVFPESVWVKGSSTSGGLLYTSSNIFTSSHLHIFSPSHLTSSHLLIFTSSHLLIFSSSHLLIFTPSHPHIFSPSHLASSHLLIFPSSHLLIFSSSHLLIFTTLHLLIFTFSYLHIFTSFHLLIFTSFHLHTFLSSHLLIFTSSYLLSLALLPSCPLALLPSCPLLLFYFSLKARGSANEAPRNATPSRNEVRSSKAEVKLRFSTFGRNPWSIGKHWGKTGPAQRSVCKSICV